MELCFRIFVGILFYALFQCAKFCHSRTRYVCRSFSFNKRLRKCVLSDSNTQMSGAPLIGEGFNTFELMSQTCK